MYNGCTPRCERFDAVANLWPTFIEGVWFLFTRSPNHWAHYWVKEEKRGKKLKRTSAFIFERNWLTAFLFWIAPMTAGVFWILFYVNGGSRPTSRTPVNDPHRAWKPFSVLMYIYGYCLCYVNIWFWSLFYHGAGQNIPSPSFWPISILRGYLKTPNWFDRRRKGHLLRAIRIVLVPVAFIACTGPLFAPFAALPLAQQWQWTHFCDPFSGEVELQGTTNPLQTPIARFYYPASGNNAQGTLQYEYVLVKNYSEAGLMQQFSYNGPSNSPPDVSSISYNLTDHTFSIYCRHTSPSTLPCATGNYTTSPYLSFIIRDSDTGKETRLRAQDKEWEFSNDAPSFILKVEDSGGHLGDVDIQSAVTKRSHCEILKVCMSSSAQDSATLVPLGIALMAQDVYSQYCFLPRLYTI